VLLGTDHHPFDRLVAWADRWADEHPEHHVLVQHGHTTAPSRAKAVDFLSPEDLRAALGDADVIVTHGGPGTITDARSCGRRPIVVPRDPRRGEHVDEHQQRFGTWVQGKDLATLARETAELDVAVLTELEHPSRITPGPQDGVGAPARLAALLDDSRARATTGPVVYIAGSGRSGSTILEHILGQDPRVATLGEVHHLWERGIEKNELCGCGSPFHDCAFWTAVGERAFEGWDRVDLPAFRDAARKVDRQRWVVKTAAPRMSRAMTEATVRYTEHYRRIYQAAKQVSGAEVVIDSGKHPSLALALTHNSDLDLRVLHLVRDSLGVSYSWSKSVARPEARSADDALMTRYSAGLSSALWMTTNLEAELVRARGRRVVRMRYEAFVEAPQEQIERVWRGLRLPGEPPDLVDESGTVSLAPNHTVAGNPARFAEGSTTLRPDRAWTTQMSRRDRWQVALLTAPLRALYGYRSMR
jgi:UDP-N-acetylglucosamine transferase subunit ALG13